MGFLGFVAFFRVLRVSCSFLRILSVLRILRVLNGDVGVWGSCRLGFLGFGVLSFRGPKAARVPKPNSSANP